MEFSHACQKYFMVPENQKNSKKIPTLAIKGRKCKKCVGKLWNKFPEIPKNSEKILKNIRKFPTAVKRAENAINPAKNQKNPKNIHHPWSPSQISSQSLPNLTQYILHKLT